MATGKKLSYEHIQTIRENLINIALVVGAIAAFPLLVSSLLRIHFQGFSYLWMSHAIIYMVFLSVVIFRKRLDYTTRTGVMILEMFALGIIDFFDSGFSSPGFIWLMSASIITAIFFDFKRTIIMLIASVIAIVLFFSLYISTLSPNDFNQNLLSMVINRTLIVVLIVFITSYSLNYIHKHLIYNIEILKTQKENLNQITLKLKEEIKARERSEKQVISSERNFENIFKQSTEAIAIADRQGEIIDFNESFAKLADVKKTNQQDKNNAAILPDDFKNNFRNCWNIADSKNNRYNIRYKKRDNYYYYECTRSTISYNNEEAIMFIIRDNTEKINFEKTSYLMAINAEEKERSRFSKELHDGLGPLLSTLKIYLEMFYSNPEDPEIKKRINNTLTESITTVKEISNNLSPYMLENFGFVKAIESFIEKLSYSKKIDINLSSNINERFKPEIEIAFFRIITELINNTIKHSKAANIIIKLVHQADKLSLSYTDNGEGFDYEKILKLGKGIGLFNLESRISKLGGDVEIVTSPGNGFKMNIYIAIY